MEQGIDVNNQSVGVDRGRESRPDIVVDRRVAVEIKALKTKRELQRGLGQLQEYSHIFPYVILYLYDPEGISRGIEAKIQNTEIIRYPR